MTFALPRSDRPASRLLSAVAALALLWVSPDAHGRHPPRGDKLDLSKRNLTDRDLEALVVQGKLTARVDELLLSDNRLTARAIAIIGRSQISGLLHVDLSGNRIGDEGAKLLGSTGLFHSARTVRLERNGITAKGVRHLFEGSPHFRPWGLFLDGNPIKDEGVGALVAIKDLQPEALGLAGCGITDKGARLLAESVNWQNRRCQLTLDGNPITPQGRKLIRESPSLKGCSPLFGSLSVTTPTERT